MDFEIIEGITQADIAFRIRGRDLNELFISGANALLSVMIRNIDLSNNYSTNQYSLDNDIVKEVRLENENLEMLFYDFLQEIIFYKDSESLILFPKTIEVVNKGNLFRLFSILRGEVIDNKKHQIGVDVKSVTFHQLKIEKTNNTWSGTFILDI